VQSLSYHILGKFLTSIDFALVPFKLKIGTLVISAGKMFMHIWFFSSTPICFRLRSLNKTDEQTDKWTNEQARHIMEPIMTAAWHNFTKSHGQAKHLS